MTALKLSMADSDWGKLFTPRECQVIAEVCKAKRIEDIAEDIGLSKHTVKEYLKEIYYKAQVHSARELMLKYYDPPHMRILAQRREFSRDLLASLETLNQSGSLHALVKSLCAGSVKTSIANWSELYRVIQESPLTIAAWGESDKLLQPPSSLLKTVLASGFGLAQGGEWKAESKFWSYLGGKGAMMAVRLKLGQHLCILAVSKPKEGNFDHLGLATLGLLARTAEQHSRRLLRAANQSRRKDREIPPEDWPAQDPLSSSIAG